MKKSWLNKGIVFAIILAIFMAPISAGLKTDKNNNLALGVEVNKAEADALISIATYSGNGVGNTSASYTATVNNTPSDFNSNLGYDLYEKTWNGDKVPTGTTSIINGSFTLKTNTPTQSFQILLKGLKPQTNYVLLVGFITISTSIDWKSALTLNYNNLIQTNVMSSSLAHVEFTTSASDNTIGTTTVNTSNSTFVPTYGCSLTDPSSWFSNCIAVFLYNVIFQPISQLALIAAKILDFFVYYSTNSTSYKSDFISKAWGAVRDIANIFFIIALLYVAIKTILGLNVTDNKKLVGAVIIVGLIINFSLFTTELVIDSSNILAKVFYNNITSVDTNKNTLPAGFEGEKSISTGLVRQFDPQDMVNGDVAGHLGEFFILIFCSITLLAFMIYIFLSVALLFVARVVSLWISMIFSPIAFASYTVPFDIPGFGHKEWWKGLIENAMLAPLFIFFLYIIILFGNFFNLITYDTSITSTWQLIMKTVIPFFIVFILLKKAKELAVKYSGEIGKAIQSIGAVAGGLALGGAGLGLASIGRMTAGKIIKEASTGESVKKLERFKKAEIEYTGAENKHNKATIEHEESKRKLDEVKLANSPIMNPNWTDEQKRTGQEKIVMAEKELNNKATEKEKTEKELNFAGQEMNIAKAEKEKMNIADKTFGKLGSWINKDQEHVEHAAHARHELDTTAESKFNGKKFKELTGPERDEIIKLISKNEMAQKKYGKKYKDIKIEDKEDVDNIIMEQKIKGEKTEGEKFFEQSKEKQSIGSSLLQTSRTGSWDIRNLSKVTPVTSDSASNKIVKGITSTLANSIRGGLKSSLNINYGEGQKNFIKDLGNTITEALKGAKINVNLSGLGEVKAEVHKGGHNSGGGAHSGGGHAKPATEHGGGAHSGGEKH